MPVICFVGNLPDYHYAVPSPASYRVQDYGKYLNTYALFL